MSFACMSYVLEQTKQQQVLALAQLGWPVSRIAAAAHVDRATVTRYLRAAGLPVRGRGRPREGTANAAISPEVSTDSAANPAFSSSEVSTDSAPARAPSASACEPYRELIAAALARGRNAVAIYQDLVDDHGFTAKYASVRRFVLKLRDGIAGGLEQLFAVEAVGELMNFRIARQHVNQPQVGADGGAEFRRPTHYRNVFAVAADRA